MMRRLGPGRRLRQHRTARRGNGPAGDWNQTIPGRPTPSRQPR